MGPRDETAVLIRGEPSELACPWTQETPSHSLSQEDGSRSDLGRPAPALWEVKVCR